MNELDEVIDDLHDVSLALADMTAERDNLRAALAATQAREAQYREALIKIRDWDDCMQTAEKTAIKALRYI